MIDRFVAKSKPIGKDGAKHPKKQLWLIYGSAELIEEMEQAALEYLKAD